MRLAVESRAFASQGGEVVLAPAYDMVPHAHNLSGGRFALAIDGECRHHAVTAQHLRAEFETWGIRHTEVVITEDLDRMVALLDEEVLLGGARASVHEDIRRFVVNLRAGKAVGADGS